MSLFTGAAEMIAPDRALKGRAKAIPTAPLSFISRRPLKGSYPESLEVAHSAMGCFWGVGGAGVVCTIGVGVSA